MEANNNTTGSAGNTWLSEELKQQITGEFFTGKAARDFEGVVFIFDKIPEKKLQNAMKRYAPIQGGEEAVLLYDKSAKEGVVLTTTRLYVNLPHDANCSVNESVAVADITNFGLRKGKGFGNINEYIEVDAGSKTLRIAYIYGEPLMNLLSVLTGELKHSGVAGVAGEARPQGSTADVRETGSAQAPEGKQKICLIAGAAVGGLIGLLGGFGGLIAGAIVGAGAGWAVNKFVIEPKNS